MAEEVLLLLGSNLGRRVRNLREGVERISREVEVSRVSGIYAGEPSGRVHQPWFLNLALLGTTDLPPEELLAFAKKVERAGGRRGAARWGPRQLDVDILLMGGLVVRKPHLEIPHPMLGNRRFCLLPAAEIAPDRAVPPGGEALVELLSRCRDTHEVTPL